MWTITWIRTWGGGGGGHGRGGEYERSRQKKGVGGRQAQFVVAVEGIDHLLIVFEWMSGDW